ncbi:MAG: hypothetical protein HY554_07490 [Elusimicrobia bacterium]|nr:hypothetical protein [Elusimicrobiota bacterium]
MNLEDSLPAVRIWMVGGLELRQAPLPSRRLIRLLRYVEANAALLEGFAEGTTLSSAVESFLPTANEVVRQLLWNDTNLSQLSDDWCGDNLTVEHYRRIAMCAIEENGLEVLFAEARRRLAEGLERPTPNNVEGGA